MSYNIHMNSLSRNKRIKILRLLVEGLSIRSISRVEDVSQNTVAKLLHEAGDACRRYHSKHVRGIDGKRKIQCDEVWSFVYAKDHTLESVKPDEEPIVPLDVAGSVWTFTAIDSESKLLISYFVQENRDTRSAVKLFRDIKGRLDKTPLLFTDGLEAYTIAAGRVFNPRQKVLTQVRKSEESDHTTSYVERHNLTIRMSTRRYNRKTNAFSKRMTQHRAAMHLFAVWYNFCRVHRTLKVSPAMEAGLTDTLYDMDLIEQLVTDQAPKPRKPGPAIGTKYRKRK